MRRRRRIRRSLSTDFSPGISWYKQRAWLRAQMVVHAPALLLGERVRRPVFVMGAPRSGTTLLYRILRASPHFAHWRPGEAHEVWELDHHPAFRGWESNVLTETDATPQVARRIRRTFYLVSGPRRRFIDKTPRNMLRVPFVNALFPDAVYVFLQREGRENVNSLINAWRSPRYRVYELPEPHRIPDCDPRWWKFVLYPGWQQDVASPVEYVCARQWTISNDYALDARDLIDPGSWVTVRYEDLVDDPVREVGRIVERLEVPYDDAVRAQAAGLGDQPVNYVTLPERGKWRRENPDEIERITDLIAPTMKRLGYSLEPRV